MITRKYHLPFLRLTILILSLVFVALTAGEQYEMVRTMVRFICTSCMGLDT